MVEISIWNSLQEIGLRVSEAGMTTASDQPKMSQATGLGCSGWFMAGHKALLGQKHRRSEDPKRCGTD
jgi:hypothetical protein